MLFTPSYVLRRHLYYEPRCAVTDQKGLAYTRLYAVVFPSLPSPTTSTRGRLLALCPLLLQANFGRMKRSESTVKMAGQPYALDRWTSSSSYAFPSRVRGLTPWRSTCYMPADIIGRSAIHAI